MMLYRAKTKVGTTTRVPEILRPHRHVRNKFCVGGKKREQILSAFGTGYFQQIRSPTFPEGSLTVVFKQTSVPYVMILTPSAININYWHGLIPLCFMFVTSLTFVSLYVWRGDEQTIRVQKWGIVIHVCNLSQCIRDFCPLNC